MLSTAVTVDKMFIRQYISRNTSCSTQVAYCQRPWQWRAPMVHKSRDASVLNHMTVCTQLNRRATIKFLYCTRPPSHFWHHWHRSQPIRLGSVKYQHPQDYRTLSRTVFMGNRWGNYQEVHWCLMAWCCLSAALGGQFPYCLIQSLHVTNTTFAVLGCWSWRSGSRLSREPPNSCRWNSTTSQLLQPIGIRSIRDHQHTFQVC